MIISVHVYLFYGDVDKIIASQEHLVTGTHYYFFSIYALRVATLKTICCKRAVDYKHLLGH